MVSKKKKRAGNIFQKESYEVQKRGNKKKKRLHSDNLLLGTNKKAERSSYRGEQQEQSWWEISDAADQQ